MKSRILNGSSLYGLSLEEIVMKKVSLITRAWSGTGKASAESIEKEQVMPTTKRRALILISSGRQLPLVEPAEVKSISTGFFLVEVAQVLKEFENDYEFTFATPDGNAPQLDINGMGLAMHAIEKVGAKSIPLGMQQRRRSFDVSRFTYLRK